MPTNISGSGAGGFDFTPYVAPAPADSRANAAEVIQNIVQKAANNLAYLESEAVKADSGGTILDGQVLSFIWGALSQASDLAGLEFSPQIFGEPFSHLIRAQCGSSYMGVYANVIPNSAREQFAIVVNAEWDITTHKWKQVDATKESFGLLVRCEESPGPVNTRVIVGKQAAGAAAWTTWVRADVEAGTLIANAATIDHPTGDFTFLAGRTTTTLMGSGSARAGGHDGGNGSMLTDGSLGHAFVDLRFPTNWDASAAAIEVVHYQATSAPATVRLVERVVNFSTPAAATQTTLVQDVGPASSGYKKRSLSLFGVTFDQANKEYRLVWIPGDAADKFEGWRITGWKDRGPRNTLA